MPIPYKIPVLVRICLNYNTSALMYALCITSALRTTDYSSNREDKTYSVLVTMKEPLKVLLSYIWDFS